MASPINWGDLPSRLVRRKLHNCLHPDCEYRTAGKYCRMHMGMLNEQMQLATDVPSFRESRRRNQKRLAERDNV